MADTIDIQGIPEGVKVVRLGIVSENDYYITSVGGQVTIQQAQSHEVGGVASVGVIVAPADGWTFRARDIKTFSYMPVKLLNPAVDIVETVHFQVTNSYDQDAVKEALDKLRMLPGFIAEKPE